ncbi:hypothetical protein SUGI_0094330 [Cryptomeria japonica]|nr:hypothetical protein SUGI_0094330 [Cryptomeria japonica]
MGYGPGMQKRGLLIQGHALVLSGLTLQLLGYFDIQNINVFGYVLPGVALAQSGGRNQGGALFIPSTVLLSAATICLVLCLGFAILHGKFLRDKLLYKIPRLFAPTPQDQNRPRTIKDQMFDAWVVARGFLEKNWLKTLPFAPLIASIVTTCVAMVVIKVGCQKSVLRNNVDSSFCFRCIFILTGWIIIVWRSLLFCLYCVSDKDALRVGHCMTLRISCRLIYLYLKIALDPLRIFASIVTLVFMLLYCLLIGLFIVLIGPLLLPLLLTTGLFVFLIPLRNLNFIATKKADVRGEQFIMAASSYNETHNSMVRADQIGQDSGELLDVIGRSVVENRRLVVRELQHSLHWKMAAVAAISVIVELADGREVDQNVQVAIKAFKQAEDLLEVLDCPGNLAVDPINLFDTRRLEAYRLNLEAQNKMLKLENLARNGGQRYQASMQEVHQVVDWFRMPANKDPVGQRIAFYKDWTKQKFCFRNVHTAGEKKKSMECMCCFNTEKSKKTSAEKQLKSQQSYSE